MNTVCLNSSFPQDFSNKEEYVMAVMETSDILKIIPHRYPFMLVDRILEFDRENKRIVGVKNLTYNELFFQGHFPGEPVMPGVLQLEAMAQVAGVMMNSILEDSEGKVAYFVAVNNAKFRRIVKPGDQLRMEIEATRVRTRMTTIHGKAYVDDELACEADLMFGYGA